MDKRNPNLRLPFLAPALSVPAVTTQVTPGDVNKVFFTSTGTGTYTLPKATAGTGPFYFYTTSLPINTVINAQGTDTIDGIGASWTLPSTYNANVALYCFTAGHWCIISGGGFLAGPIMIGSGNGVNTAAVATLIVTAPGSNAVVSETGRAAIFGGQPNAYTVEVSASATSGQSYGLVIRAGSNTSDAPFVVVNQAQTASLLSMTGAGGLTVGAPTSAITAFVVTANSTAGTSSATFTQNTGQVIITENSTTDLVINPRGSSGKNTWLQFTENAVADRWFIGTLAGNSNLLFRTGTITSLTTRVTIDSSGNLGLHGNTPAAQVTGWGTPTGAAVVANFPGASATLVQCSEVIAKIITDLKSLGLYAA